MFRWRKLDKIERKHGSVGPKSNVAPVGQPEPSRKLEFNLTIFQLWPVKCQAIVEMANAFGSHRCRSSCVSTAGASHFAPVCPSIHWSVGRSAGWSAGRPARPLASLATRPATSLTVNPIGRQLPHPRVWL